MILHNTGRVTGRLGAGFINALILFMLATLCAAGVAAIRTGERTGNRGARLSAGEAPLVHISISEPAFGAPRINPRLFSNFLEHLGGAVYDQLWANVVSNPRFASDKQGRLWRWSRTAGARWESVDSEMPGAPAQRAMRLPAGQACWLAVTLPADRERKYSGSIRALSLGRGARLEVRLTRSAGGDTLACQELSVPESGAAIPIRFDLPAGAAKTGEPLQLRITTLQGEAQVRMVELFPTDSVGGVDPEVLALAKAQRIELLRWPGGNFVSGYHWRCGVGPRERRPSVPNPAWPGIETHHFGTDEFMEFCRRIGAKPQVCVNAGDGSPEEAASWVQYCNGDETTPMGRLRAENGHPDPYDVRVWEIGNELYGDWQIGHTKAEGNAARFKRFRDAMLRADPTIEIIATGKGDEFVGEGLERDRNWNAAVLRASAGSPPAFLSLHPLVPLPESMTRYTYAEVYESAMAHPKWWGESFVPELMGQIRAALGADARTRIAATEWGIILGGPQWPHFPNHDSQAGAIYAALFLHAAMRAAPEVEIANVTALMHGGGIKRRNQKLYVDPMYYVQRMYSAARPSRLLSVRTDTPVHDVPARGFLPSVNRVPDLDVLAAETARGRIVFIVNRRLSGEVVTEVDFGRAVGKVEIETLAAGPEVRNSPDSPDRVRPVQVTEDVRGRTLRRRLPPCSVTVFRFR